MWQWETQYQSMILIQNYTNLCLGSQGPILCWLAPDPSLGIPQCNCPASRPNFSSVISLVDCYKSNRCQYQGINYWTGRSAKGLMSTCQGRLGSTICWNFLWQKASWVTIRCPSTPHICIQLAHTDTSPTLLSYPILPKLTLLITVPIQQEAARQD